MARSTRPLYIATRPDGTVPPTSRALAEYARQSGETIPTVNLADHISETVDHPSPGRKWYTDKPFSYFHMYSQPGEILERVEGWPVLLFAVEPLGETGNWSAHHPYWLMSHQVRVLDEAPAWRALGHRGQQVLNLIDQLPSLARQWADEWAADPDNSRQRYDAWSERVTDNRARQRAHHRAQTCRRKAAFITADALARTAAVKAATEAGAAPDTVNTIRLRARCLAVGELLHDRLRSGEYEKSIRELLLGAGLDTAASAAS
ncbi:hypothetical protein [Streptomyces lydicus]|uniref:hypothetical protein n=1 Tax=Streptomyces lydicus TaxID=47763 RepID=UPI0010111F0C|nr:hypothetical protein [Streptomyces lydicus]MCZ1012680.1 hypothetical protein [Streptomyces lydicus]